MSSNRASDIAGNAHASMTGREAGSARRSQGNRRSLARTKAAACTGETISPRPTVILVPVIST